MRTKGGEGDGGTKGGEGDGGTEGGEGDGGTKEGEGDGGHTNAYASFLKVTLFPPYKMRSRGRSGIGGTKWMNTGSGGGWT